MIVGENVSMLALIDTPGPGHIPNQSITDAEILNYLIGSEMGIYGDSGLPKQLDDENRLQYALEKIQAKYGKWVIPELMDLRHILRVFRVNMWAMFAYRPKPWDGNILFFRAQEQGDGLTESPECGWIDLAKQGTEVYDVPGDHITL